MISHPAWSQMSLADAAAIKAAHAVEVYNQDCYAGCDRGYGFRLRTATYDDRNFCFALLLMPISMNLIISVDGLW